MEPRTPVSGSCPSEGPLSLSLTSQSHVSRLTYRAYTSFAHAQRNSSDAVGYGWMVEATCFAVSPC